MLYMYSYPYITCTWWSQSCAKPAFTQHTFTPTHNAPSGTGPKDL